MTIKRAYSKQHSVLIVQETELKHLDEFFKKKVQGERNCTLRLRILVKPCVKKFTMVTCACMT